MRQENAEEHTYLAMRKFRSANIGEPTERRVRTAGGVGSHTNNRLITPHSGLLPSYFEYMGIKRGWPLKRWLSELHVLYHSISLIPTVSSMPERDEDRLGEN